MSEPAGFLGAILAVIAFIIVMGVVAKTAPERPCLHAPNYCKNTTRNFSGYCDDCLSEWGPSI